MEEGDLHVLLLRHLEGLSCSVFILCLFLYTWYLLWTEISFMSLQNSSVEALIPNVIVLDMGPLWDK